MKPLLYRSGSKRSLFVAFAAAAAIHVSALAFTPTHHAVVVASDDGVVDVGFESPPPESDPEPRELEIAPAVAPSESNEFAETPQSAVRPLSKPARPIHPNRMPGMQRSQPGSGKLFAISAPRPTYPYEARSHHITGSGLVILDVDPVTGTVVNAALTQSTGSPILDNSAVSAFRHWRFKSGTPSRVRIPFTFTMFGAQF
jgi:TonB family protein